MNKELEHNIKQLTDKILSDYGNNRDIDKTNIFSQPDKDVVIELLNNLKKIIFPGYFKNKAYKFYTVQNNISLLVEDVLYNLTKQIELVLRYNSEYENADRDTIAEKAQSLAFEFLNRIPLIRDYINDDVQAAFDGDPAAFNKDEIIFSYPGFFAICVYRIAHQLHLLGIPLIPRMMTEYAHNMTGIDIHPGATIGRNFFIDHGTGIVIGETTEIGDNVKIYQGVTLGALSTRGGQSLKNKKRHPTIKDNVTIYSGASILGGETVIGKDVVIGGNAFITKSVPDGAKVSIKNQELHVNYDKSKSDDSEDDSWFYII